MFCSKCGTENADSSLFCKNCGGELHKNTGYAPPAGGAYSAYTVSRPKTVSEAVIKTLSSPKMLVLCILYTITAAWSLISSFFGNTVSETVISQIFDEYGVYFPYDEMTPAFSVSALIGIVPAALILAGLWMTFSAAKNVQVNGEMKTGGMTVIKVILIIKMVFSIILSLLTALLLGMVAAMGDIATLPATYSDQIDGFDNFGGDFGGFDFAPYSGFNEAMTVLAIAICAIIFIVLAVHTVLLALSVRENGNIARMSRCDTFGRNISMTLIVFTFICAGGNLLVGSFLRGAVYVLAAVVLLDMRSNINAVLYAPQTSQI